MNKILICLLALIPAGQALAAACDAETATAFAQRLYAKHYNFYSTGGPGLKTLVSPALYRALRNHYRCEGVCHLDYEPWLGAQDGEIGPPVTFNANKVDKSGATVEMHYQFLIATTVPPKPQRVILRLKPSAPPQCWRLDDLVTPLGDSLRQSYLQKE